ncbi:MAG: ROK family transcriptional regulator [Paraburkholderia sp.]|uniref:ROK family transcriptional regulator n=1 Tax=Paraburkholderia sp. TaxID=1926495 RepID=UPI001228391D|nr:ROK family transcriptional regulator [Paraburkholderia sp.]TAM05317.1 MAG: ROK family transcriptional regulator [Paraburkholderia sp.]
MDALAAQQASSQRHARTGFTVSPSERIILDAVRRHRSISRAALTVETDLSQQSVHRLVDQLMERGLLVAGEAIRKGRGQPSPQIELVRTAAYAIGISVSTDSMTLCLADFSGDILEEIRLRIPPLHRNASLRALRDAMDRLVKRNSVDRARIIGIGFTISGFFVHGRKHVNAPAPLQDWSLTDLQTILESTFELPVWMENDASSAAIGESILGVGTWARNFFYLNFSYGFGGGVVLNGKPYFGSHGNAGEMMFDKEESRRRPALKFLIAELRANGIDIDSIEDLRMRFDPQWPGVEPWIERTLPALDRVINTLAGLFDPDAIVFGGLLPPTLGNMLIERVQFWEHRNGVGPALPKLVLSETNGDATVIGAAVMPLKNTFFL